MYITVLLDKGIKKPLTYKVPEHLLSNIAEGKRVLIPLQKRSVKGTILSTNQKKPRYEVKDIDEIISEEVINADLKELATWMAKFYVTPLPYIMKTLLPASIRKDTKVKKQQKISCVLRGKKLIEYTAMIREKHPKRANVLDILLKHKYQMLMSMLLEKKASLSCINTLVKENILKKELIEIDRSDLVGSTYFKTSPKKLNEQQAEAFSKIKESIDKSEFKSFLLHGITGSGKTEVYLQAIERALEQKKGVIMLIPEIALTSQIKDLLKHRFEDRIAILHYRLSDGEKADAWRNIQQGKIPIVIGARSAVFSPVKNLGLIIVDEEHELSYKQIEEMPCYNARDVAVKRAHISNCPVILGSATPSIESVYNVMEKKYEYLKMTKRAAAKNPPKVSIINMQEERESGKAFSLLSHTLLSEIKKRIDIGEQVILFLNRRGYFSCRICTECNETISCPSCDSSLTYHKNDNILACHLCGYETSTNAKCSHCKSSDTLKYRGPGTEQVERSLHAIFPDIRTLRMDRDTTKHKGSHEEILKQFRAGKADVLIGTQMIAKGLDFPLVTLAAVIGADSSLHIPDYRATENLYQVITQVVGRSGRGELPGISLIQTNFADHLVMKACIEGDFKKFIKEEMADRKLCSYPPYTKLIKLIFTSTDHTKAFNTAEKFYDYLKRIVPAKNTLYKPMPCGYAKIKDKFRFQILIKAKEISLITHILNTHCVKIPSKVHLLIDVNATSTFS